MERPEYYCIAVAPRIPLSRHTVVGAAASSVLESAVQTGYASQVQYLDPLHRPATTTVTARTQQTSTLDLLHSR